MVDPSTDPGTGDMGGSGDRAPGMPRWVKTSLIVVLVVVLLIVILLLTGGHGPGRHRSSGGAGQGSDFGKHTHTLVDGTATIAR